jgi:hypothetical protein
MFGNVIFVELTRTWVLSEQRIVTVTQGGFALFQWNGTDEVAVLGCLHPTLVGRGAQNPLKPAARQEQGQRVGVGGHMDSSSHGVSITFAA